MDTLRTRTDAPQPSRIVVTFACGHGARVATDERPSLQEEIRAGLTCPACQAR